MSNLNDYIHSVKIGSVTCETELLSPIDQLNEYIMTSLRTSWGCNLQLVQQLYGSTAELNIKREASSFIAEGKMFEKSGFLIVAPEYRLFTDGLASSLFTIAE